MKTQIKFVNASIVSIVNGAIVIKNSDGIEHTFTNASVVSVNNGTIIIESEWVPKNGELVRVEGEDCIPHYVIFTSQNNRILYGYGCVNTKFNPYSNVRLYSFVWHLGDKTKILPVTPEEQKEFDDFCKSQGKIWNKETLQWEKYVWEPKRGEKYYYIDTLGDVSCTTYNTFALDSSRIKFHNCFPTKEQAKIAAEKVKELLKSL